MLLPENEGLSCMLLPESERLSCMLLPESEAQYVVCCCHKVKHSTLYVVARK